MSPKTHALLIRTHFLFRPRMESRLSYCAPGDEAPYAAALLRAPGGGRGGPASTACAPPGILSVSRQVHSMTPTTKVPAFVPTVLALQNASSFCLLSPFQVTARPSLSLPHTWAVHWGSGVQHDMSSPPCPAGEAVASGCPWL